MAIAKFFLFLIISYFRPSSVNCKSVTAKSLNILGSAMLKDDLRQDNVTNDQSSNHFGPMSRYFLPYKLKRGEEAALVDLFDYMNKPKFNEKAVVSKSFPNMETPMKPWFWKTVFYDDQ